jgi:hypothetical protein
MPLSIGNKIKFTDVLVFEDSTVIIYIITVILFPMTMFILLFVPQISIGKPFSNEDGYGRSFIDSFGKRGMNYVMVPSNFSNGNIMITPAWTYQILNSSSKDQHLKTTLIQRANNTSNNFFSYENSTYRIKTIKYPSNWEKKSKIRILLFFYHH